MIIALASDPAASKAQRVFLHKLDAVLVHILKQDWPGRWPSFLPDLCAASRTSASLCENSMRILRLLSEEVFDFARGELTSSKTRDLKASLNTQFGEVHSLCMFALSAGGGGAEPGAPPTHPGLVRATLDTLHAYLSWVPLAYVFESDVVAALVRLFPAPAFRSPALRCLTEVAALAVGPEHDAAFVSLLTTFMHSLAPLIPPGTDVAAAYAAGSDDDKEFVLNLALFLTTFLRAHARALEADAACRSGPLLAALDVLASASFAPDDEVFKVCLDYWHGFVPGVYASAAGAAALAGAPPPGPLAGQAAPPPPTPGLPSGAGAFDAAAHYAPLLSRLRSLMIARMAKPEEVIVVEDEAGNVVREAMKDTDTLARYKTMHETLVYLAHLDHEDTEAQMQARLRAQVGAGAGGQGGAGTEGGTAGRWAPLNALCWAVGSIAGAMAEDQENRFLVTVIRDLLNLCEVTRGKDNKAVIAANIMYVVGQYPRFLRNHWKFLKTVVHKLFEFMHEPHPGVQDMACETFLKICGKCRRKFVVTQLGESEPFVAELLAGLADTIRDLEAHQVR
jgi:exportin-1